jgi:dimethylamine---corrinoid protein Co-methyltransferase
VSEIQTRMGDGYTVTMTPDEVKADLVAGSEDAARRGKVPVLEESELDWLFDLFANPSRIMGVERGHEVVLTKDGSVNTLYSAQLSSGVGLSLRREQAFRVFERAFCFDTMEIGHPDYSFKPVKAIVALEAVGVEQALHGTIIPVFYGAMPNFGLYARPDGPFPNPADLLPKGQIAEAREAQMEMAEMCRDDMVYVSKKMAAVGADGINFDTTASAGDAEFLATLQAVEELAASTDLAIEVGMAAEMVLGFHGELDYDGKKLAGMWPHQQVKVVEKAGAHLFGPVVNTNTRKSTPWNVARATTFVKECSKVAEIPIHANVGMGVGGVPMYEVPPADVLTRCSAAMVEIGRVDGL